jgi:hypothetical protein
MANLCQKFGKIKLNILYEQEKADKPSLETPVLNASFFIMLE